MDDLVHIASILNYFDFIAFPVVLKGVYTNALMISPLHTLWCTSVKIHQVCKLLQYNVRYKGIYQGEQTKINS